MVYLTISFIETAIRKLKKRTKDSSSRILMQSTDRPEEALISLAHLWRPPADCRVGNRLDT